MEVSESENLKNVLELTRVSEPHHFNADPDPSFHFHADLDPAPIKVTQICDHLPPGRHFEPSLLNFERPRPSTAPASRAS
jgi:hypothetical protein